ERSTIPQRAMPILSPVSPGCALRLFAGALTDFVAEVRNLVGDTGSRFFSTSRCDKDANSYADANSDQQSADPAEYLRIFLAAKCVGRTTKTVEDSVISV